MERTIDWQEQGMLLWFLSCPPSVRALTKKKKRGAGICQTRQNIFSITTLYFCSNSPLCLWLKDLILWGFWIFSHLLITLLSSQSSGPLIQLFLFLMLTRSLCVGPFSVPAITLQFCCCKEGWQSVLVKLVTKKLSLLTVPAKKCLLKIVIYNDS